MSFDAAALESAGLRTQSWVNMMLNRLKAHWTSATLGAIILFLVSIFCLCIPFIEPNNPLIPVGTPFTPPFHGFLLGTDSIGRDELSQVLAGMESSWFSALLVIASGVIIGTIVGLVAGASRSWLDDLLMRITDAFLSLPGPVLAIAVVAALGPSLVHTLVAVSIVWWPFYARIVRGEVKALSSRPHVEAARLTGVSHLRLMIFHLLPGALPAIVVTASLDVGNLILTLAGLSFIGLGAPAPAPELGALAARNLPYLLQDWWTSVMPCLGIFFLAFISNICGDLIRGGLKQL